MSISGFIWILYDIISYPLKKLWRYFNPYPPVVIGDKKNNVSEFIDSFSMHYKKKLPNETQGKIYNRPYDYHGKIYYKPLFDHDYFSRLSEAKNDSEFKKTKELVIKREERNKAREKFMKNIKETEKDDGGKPTIH